MTETITRANVEAAKQLVVPRLGDKYVYGGMFDQDVHDGTDCSGVWNDVLGMVVGRFQWGREAEGATTESYRYIPVGGVGPFGTVRVASPNDIPPNAVAKLAFHHEGNGGASSHMWGELDGMRIESAGSKGLVTAPAAWEITNPYANAWAYLPGPILEDGTPVTTIEPPDTMFADVSEWQTGIDDSYPYRVVSIRSNDGNHRDLKWANNYAWCKRAVDSGKLAFFLVYFVYRPGVDSVAVLKDMVGTPHPKMAVEIDIESWGGQIRGDQSAGLNAAHDEIAQWLGDPRRVIGYGNRGDLDSLWPNKPAGLRIRLAAYGSNPDYPGKIAHQYTDGQGYGGGLPEGAAPFGNCDMNSADGYTATAFAAALGLDTGNPAPPPPATGGGGTAPDPDADPGTDGGRILSTWQQIRLRWKQLRGLTLVEAVGEVLNQLKGVDDKGWAQLGQNERGENLSLVDGVAATRKDVAALQAAIAELAALVKAQAPPATADNSIAVNPVAEVIEAVKADEPHTDYKPYQPNTK